MDYCINRLCLSIASSSPGLNWGRKVRPMSKEALVFLYTSMHGSIHSLTSIIARSLNWTSTIVPSLQMFHWGKTILWEKYNVSWGRKVPPMSKEALVFLYQHGSISLLTSKIARSLIWTYTILAKCQYFQEGYSLVANVSLRKNNIMQC